MDIVGGGISGCTAALILSQKYKVNLYEKGKDILQGPPWCHLHAGGFLYPMLSMDECRQLFIDSLYFANFFKDCLLERPTIVAYNKFDMYEPIDLLKKADNIKTLYKEVTKNYIFGDPENFYNVYTKEEVLNYKKTKRFTNNNPHNKYVETFIDILEDIDSIKYPFISVNEFGICMESAKSKIKYLISINKNINMYLDTQIDKTKLEGVVIDATGQQILGNGFLEMKASWMIRNVNDYPYFPEIAIIGQRNTEHGLLQITPHGNHTYQIHYMNNNCTLFTNGRVKIGEPFMKKQLTQSEINIRTQNAINKTSSFFPPFKSSTISPLPPLWGVQRIPGNDIDKRTSGPVKINEELYELHVTKGISSINCAMNLIKMLD